MIINKSSELSWAEQASDVLDPVRIYPVLEKNPNGNRSICVFLSGVKSAKAG